MDAKHNENAVRSGLDFLCFVADEYIRLEVYAYQECDGNLIPLVCYGMIGGYAVMSRNFSTDAGRG